MFGPSEAGAGRARIASSSSARRAGITLRYPDDLPDLCCGTPWRSKGMKAGYARDGAAGCCRRCGGQPAGRAAGRVRRRVLHRGSAADAGARSPTAAAGTRRCGSSTRWRSSHEQRAAAAGASPAGSRRWRCTRPARPPGWGSNDVAARGRRRGGRHGHGAGQLGLLRLRRRPRPAASRAHRVGHRRRRPPRSRRGAFDALRVVQPHLRAGHDQGHRAAVPARAGTGGLGERR